MKLSIAKVIDTAIMRCGVPTPFENPEIIMRAKENLYQVLLDFANRGIPIFMVKSKLIGLEPYKWKYNLDPRTVDIFALNWRQFAPVATIPTGGTNPELLNDRSWYTYSTTTNEFNLEIFGDQPLNISTYGFVPYGNQTASFVVESTSELYTGLNSQWREVELSFVGSWRGSAYGNGKFIVVAFESNLVAISSDNGETWESSSIVNTQQWNSIEFINGYFFAVAGNYDHVAKSLNGVDWVFNALPANRNWIGLASGDNTIVAIANNSDKGAYSTDFGETWQEMNMPTTANWKAVEYGNGVFVAISTNDDVAAWSSDGINWAVSTLPQVQYWSGIKFANGKFIVCASNGSPIFASTTNGQTWSAVPIPLPGNYQAISHGNELFVAVQTNSDISIYSEDGETWEFNTLPLAINWITVAFGNGTFVSASTGGAIAAINRESFVTWKTIGVYENYELIDGQWTWVDLDTPQLTKNVRIRLTQRGSLSLRGYYLAGTQNTYYEQVCGKLNRDDFFSYPNKGANGTPLIYYFQKTTIPQLQLWQAPLEPNVFVWLLNVYVFEIPKDDELLLPSELPTPDWYVDAIIWNLAVKLMYELPNVSPERMAMVKQEATQRMNEAEYMNSDTTNIDLVGNALSPYQRKW